MEERSHSNSNSHFQSCPIQSHHENESISSLDTDISNATMKSENILKAEIIDPSISASPLEGKREKGKILSYSSDSSNSNSPPYQSKCYEWFFGNPKKTLKRFIILCLLILLILFLLNAILVSVGFWQLATLSSNSIKFDLIELRGLDSPVAKLSVEGRILPGIFTRFASVIIHEPSSVNIRINHEKNSNKNHDSNDKKNSNDSDDGIDAPIVTIDIPNSIKIERGASVISLKDIQIKLNPKANLVDILKYFESTPMSRQEIIVGISVCIESNAYWFPFSISKSFNQILNVGSLMENLDFDNKIKEGNGGNELKAKSKLAKDAIMERNALEMKSNFGLRWLDIVPNQQNNFEIIELIAHLKYPHTLVPEFLKIHIPKIELEISHDILREKNEKNSNYSSFVKISTIPHVIIGKINEEENHNHQDFKLSLTLSSKDIDFLGAFLEKIRDEDDNFNLIIRGATRERKDDSMEREKQKNNIENIEKKEFSPLQQWLNELEYEIPFKVLKRIQYSRDPKPLKAASRLHKRSFKNDDANSSFTPNSETIESLENEELLKKPSLTIGLVSLKHQQGKPCFVFDLTLHANYLDRILGFNLNIIRGKLPPIILKQYLESTLENDPKSLASIRIVHVNPSSQSSSFSTQSSKSLSEDENENGDKEIKDESKENRKRNYYLIDSTNKKSKITDKIVFKIHVLIMDTSSIVKVVHKAMQMNTLDTDQLARELQELRSILVTGSKRNFLSSLIGIFALEWKLKRDGSVHFKKAKHQKNLLKEEFLFHSKDENDKDDYDSFNESSTLNSNSNSNSQSVDFSSDQIAKGKRNFRVAHHDFKVKFGSDIKSTSMKLLLKFNESSTVNSPFILIYWNKIDLAFFPKSPKTILDRKKLKQGKEEESLSIPISNSSTLQSSTNLRYLDETEILHLLVQDGQTHLSIANLNPLTLFHNGKLDILFTIASDQYTIGNQPALLAAWSSILKAWKGENHFTPIHIIGKIGKKSVDISTCLPHKSALFPPNQYNEKTMVTWLKNIIETQLKIAGLRDATLQMLLELPPLGRCNSDKREKQVRIKIQIQLPAISVNLCSLRSGGKSKRTRIKSKIEHENEDSFISSIDNKRLKSSKRKRIESFDKNDQMTIKAKRIKNHNENNEINENKCLAQIQTHPILIGVDVIDGEFCDFHTQFISKNNFKNHQRNQNSNNENENDSIDEIHTINNDDHHDNNWRAIYNLIHDGWMDESNSFLNLLPFAVSILDLEAGLNLFDQITNSHKKTIRVFLGVPSSSHSSSTDIETDTEYNLSNKKVLLLNRLINGLGRIFPITVPIVMPSKIKRRPIMRLWEKSPIQLQMNLDSPDKKLLKGQLQIELPKECLYKFHDQESPSKNKNGNGNGNGKSGKQRQEGQEGQGEELMECKESSCPIGNEKNKKNHENRSNSKGIRSSMELMLSVQWGDTEIKFSHKSSYLILRIKGGQISFSFDKENAIKERQRRNQMERMGNDKNGKLIPSPPNHSYFSQKLSVEFEFFIDNDNVGSHTFRRIINHGYRWLMESGQHESIFDGLSDFRNLISELPRLSVQMEATIKKFYNPLIFPFDLIKKKSFKGDQINKSKRKRKRALMQRMKIIKRIQKRKPYKLKSRIKIGTVLHILKGLWRRYKPDPYTSYRKKYDFNHRITMKMKKIPGFNGIATIPCLIPSLCNQKGGINMEMSRKKNNQKHNHNQSSNDSSNDSDSNNQSESDNHSDNDNSSIINDARREFIGINIWITRIIQQTSDILSDILSVIIAKLNLKRHPTRFKLTIQIPKLILNSAINDIDIMEAHVQSIKFSRNSIIPYANVNDDKETMNHRRNKIQDDEELVSIHLYWSKYFHDFMDVLMPFEISPLEGPIINPVPSFRKDLHYMPISACLSTERLSRTNLLSSLLSALTPEMSLSFVPSKFESRLDDEDEGEMKENGNIENDKENGNNHSKPGEISLNIHDTEKNKAKFIVGNVGIWNPIPNLWINIHDSIQIETRFKGNTWTRINIEPFFIEPGMTRIKLMVTLSNNAFGQIDSRFFNLNFSEFLVGLLMGGIDIENKIQIGKGKGAIKLATKMTMPSDRPPVLDLETIVDLTRTVTGSTIRNILEQVLKKTKIATESTIKDTLKKVWKRTGGEGIWNWGKGKISNIWNKTKNFFNNLKGKNESNQGKNQKGNQRNQIRERGKGNQGKRLVKRGKSSHENSNFSIDSSREDNEDEEEGGYHYISTKDSNKRKRRKSSKSKRRKRRNHNQDEGIILGLTRKAINMTGLALQKGGELFSQFKDWLMENAFDGQTKNKRKRKRKREKAKKSRKQIKKTRKQQKIFIPSSDFETDTDDGGKNGNSFIDKNLESSFNISSDSKESKEKAEKLEKIKKKEKEKSKRKEKLKKKKKLKERKALESLEKKLSSNIKNKDIEKFSKSSSLPSEIESETEINNPEWNIDIDQYSKIENNHNNKNENSHDSSDTDIKISENDITRRSLKRKNRKRLKKRGIDQNQDSLTSSESIENENERKIRKIKRIRKMKNRNKMKNEKNNRSINPSINFPIAMKNPSSIGFKLLGVYSIIRVHDNDGFKNKSLSTLYNSFFATINQRLESLSPFRNIKRDIAIFSSILPRKCQGIWSNSKSFKPLKSQSNSESLNSESSNQKKRNKRKSFSITTNKRKIQNQLRCIRKYQNNAPINLSPFESLKGRNRVISQMNFHSISQSLQVADEFLYNSGICADLTDGIATISLQKSPSSQPFIFDVKGKLSEISVSKDDFSDPCGLLWKCIPKSRKIKNRILVKEIENGNGNGNGNRHERRKINSNGKHHLQGRMNLIQLKAISTDHNFLIQFNVAIKDNRGIIKSSLFNLWNKKRMGIEMGFFINFITGKPRKLSKENEKKRFDSKRKKKRMKMKRNKNDYLFNISNDSISIGFDLKKDEIHLLRNGNIIYSKYPAFPISSFNREFQIIIQIESIEERIKIRVMDMETGIFYSHKFPLNLANELTRSRFYISLATNLPSNQNHKRKSGNNSNKSNDDDNSNDDNDDQNNQIEMFTRNWTTSSIIPDLRWTRIFFLDDEWSRPYQSGRFIMQLYDSCGHEIKKTFKDSMPKVILCRIRSQIHLTAKNKDPLPLSMGKKILDPEDLRFRPPPIDIIKEYMQSNSKLYSHLNSKLNSQSHLNLDSNSDPYRYRFMKKNNSIIPIGMSRPIFDKPLLKGKKDLIRAPFAMLEAGIPPIKCHTTYNRKYGLYQTSYKAILPGRYRILSSMKGDKESKKGKMEREDNNDLWYPIRNSHVYIRNLW